MIIVLKLIASATLLHLELENGFRPSFIQFYRRLLSLGMSLFCFYFHLFFFLAILLFLAYYAQYFVRS